MMIKGKRPNPSIFFCLLIQVIISDYSWAQSPPNKTSPTVPSVVNLTENWLTENWNELASPGSPVNKLFKNGDYLYAGTNGGGVSRSPDDGMSWQAVNNGLLAGAKVQAFTAVGSTVFIGTDKGIYRSTDQGQNWTAANSGLINPSGNTSDPPSISALAANGSLLFAGTTGSIFRSIDQGQNWTEAKSGLPSNFDGIAFAVSGSNVFAATSAGVFRLQDNDTTWTSANFGAANSIAASGRAIFALKNEGAWRSLDQGQNWTQVFNVPPGLFQNDKATNIAVNGSIIFLSAISIGSPTATFVALYYSPDQGQHWFQANPPILFGPFVATPFTHINAYSDKVLVVRLDNKLFSSAGFYSLGLSSVSAASYIARGVASESIIAAFGLNLASSTQSAATKPLPTTLATTVVRVKDSAGVERLAPLFFVSPNQVNYLMPQGTAEGVATVTITNNDVLVGRELVTIYPISPGIFTANMNGQGVPAGLALRIKSDGTQNYETIARFDTALNRFVPLPIDLGADSDRVYLILFGTGIRNQRDPSSILVELDFRDTQVTYAGPQGEFIGLDQVNLLLPRSLAGKGEVRLSLKADLFLPTHVDKIFSNSMIVNIK